MAKIVIDNVQSGYGLVDSLNLRLQQVEDEFNTKVLYRDNPIGEANQFLTTDLDLNSNDVINVNGVYAQSLFLKGIDYETVLDAYLADSLAALEAARVAAIADVDAAAASGVSQVDALVTQAEGFAQDSEDSATASQVSANDSALSAAQAQAIVDSPILPPASGEKLSFDSLTTAIATVSSNPSAYPDETPLSTASYRSKAECTTLGIAYPDGGAASYTVTTGLASDGRLVIDVGSKQLSITPSELGITITQSGASTGAAPTDNRDAIQALWDYCAPLGLQALGASGVFEITRATGQVNSRDYGLLIPDNLLWDGIDKDLCTIRAASNADMDVVTTNRTTQLSTVTMKNTTFDGNAANQTPTAMPDQSAGGMTLWLDEIETLNLFEIRTLDSAAFGFRITMCDNVNFEGLYANHRVIDLSADGVHMQDCLNVIGNRVRIFSAGDDGLIIAATSRDIENYVISDIISETPFPSGNPIYLANVQSNTQAGIARSVKNIHITNAVLKNSGGAALYLFGAQFDNINVSYSAENCFRGFDCTVGQDSPVLSGYLKNSNIRGNITGATDTSVRTVIDLVNGTIDGCEFDFTVVNPADALDAVSMSAKNSTIHMNIDYDPNNDKVSPQIGFRGGVTKVFENNDLHLKVKGADIGMKLTAGHVDNNIYIGDLSDNVTLDFDLDPSANSNTFFGGKVAKYENGGAGNRSIGVTGLSSAGFSTYATDASGEITIPHGLIGTPKIMSAHSRSGNPWIASVNSSNSTDIVVEVRDITTGSKVVSQTGVYVSWEAALF